MKNSDFPYSNSYHDSDFIPHIHPIDTLKLFTKSFKILPANKLQEGNRGLYYSDDNFYISKVMDTIYFNSEAHKLLHQNPLYRYHDDDLPKLFDSLQSIFFDVGIEVNNLQVSRIDSFKDFIVKNMSQEIQAFSNGMLDRQGDTKIIYKNPSVSYKNYASSNNAQNAFVVYDKKLELIEKEKKKLKKIENEFYDFSKPIPDISFLYQLRFSSRMRIRKYKVLGKLLRVEYRLLNAAKIKKVFGSNEFFHVMKNLNIIEGLRDKTMNRMYVPPIKKNYDEILDQSIAISGTINNKLEKYFFESLKIRFDNDKNKIRLFLKESFSEWQYKKLWRSYVHS